MPEGAVDAGRRFASDLRGIRENRGVSLEDLHEETKIPRGLLDSFENTGLFDHPMFNRVYLRSFVRTYAEVVGVSPELVLASLEEAFTGSYQGRLATEYLGGGAAPAPPPEQAAAGEQAAPEEREAAPEAPSAAEPPAAAAPVEEPSAAEPPVEEPLEEPPVEETLPREVEAEDPEATPAAPAAAESRRRERPSPPVRQTPNRQWIYAGIGVVVLALLIWGVIALLGNGEEAEPVAEAPETEVVEDPPLQEVEEPEPEPAVVLGDTMQVEIVAANGPVREIRVTVDEDVRRPYWIEEGESQVFPVADRVIIEQQLEQIALEVEGREFPFRDFLDEQGRVVISKEAAQRFFNEQGRS